MIHIHRAREKQRQKPTKIHRVHVNTKWQMEYAQICSLMEAIGYISNNQQPESTSGYYGFKMQYAGAA